jgi:hypothetical protein
MAGDSPYGVLTLDAPQADSLGQPDLEVMKTLANLLGVGLALAAQGGRPAWQVPAQSNVPTRGSSEVTARSSLLALVSGTL